MSDVLYQNNVYDNFFQYGYAKIDKEIPLYAESFFAVQGATEDIIYKKDIKNRELISSELKRVADELASCDLSMQTIRDLINRS